MASTVPAGRKLDKPFCPCMIGGQPWPSSCGRDAVGSRRFTQVKIDLANIAGTPGEGGRFAISERLEPTETYTPVGPVTGELTVENTGTLLLVRGELHVVLRLPCVRCLTEAEETLAMDVEEEFASEGTAADVVTIDRDEPEAAAISDYLLDVGEFVRQQVVSYLPIAFVCKPDCRGICPTCGKNLNEGPCGCAPEPADDRWAKLQDFLLKGRDSAE